MSATEDAVAAMREVEAHYVARLEAVRHCLSMLDAPLVLPLDSPLVPSADDDITVAPLPEPAPRHARYGAEERASAVALAGEVGLSKAARRLDVNRNTLNGWLQRSKEPAQARSATIAAEVSSPGVLAIGARATIGAPVPGEGTHPYVCSCGEAYATAREWSRHRLSFFSAKERARHRMVDQPVARMVPSGVRTVPVYPFLDDLPAC